MGWKMQKANQSPEKTRTRACYCHSGRVSAQPAIFRVNQNGESIEIGAGWRINVVHWTA
jgi:rhodanese-related sulfurtransferase